MDEAKLQTVAQVKLFLEGTHDIALKIPKAEQYRFIKKLLKRFGYTRLSRCDRCSVTLSQTHDGPVTAAGNMIS